MSPNRQRKWGRMLSSKRVFQRLQVPRADFSTHCKSQGTKGNAIQFVDNSNNDWLRHKETINVVTASKSVSMCYIQLKKKQDHFIKYLGKHEST